MLQGHSVTPQKPQQVQAMRAVNKDLPPTSVSPALLAEIYYVDCHLDPTTQKPVVLWDDILQAFVNAVQVRDKARVVPFLKDSDLRNLEPRRIAAVPDTVLDVAVVNTKLGSSLPVSMRQEEGTISGTDVVVSHNTPATSNPAVTRNPVYGLENTAMDNYTHIDHPAFAPRPRGTQVLLDDYSLTDKDIPAPPRIDSGNTPLLRAPQSTTTKASKGMDLVQLSIRASQGDTSAQVALGDMYKGGRGVKQDYQTAMDWYLLAANQGDPVGQRKVGLLYYKGLGTTQDYSTAMNWFIKAADQEDSEA
ncbi:hypothetical protein BGZ96_003496 [Linnemannia gamsii]|uniref:HCP-like protein n=1 Tax=Linnemannia gamsii TaxID=64522 RepID=A0ABQ7JJ48_9FUNG|nr:hypothetical protein BGZ96_003496 [Linnemannia gamsii]